MFMRSFICGLSIAAIMQSPVSAAQVVITMHDCGQWLKAREAHDSSRFESYVDGMIDGMSLGSSISIKGNGYDKYSPDQIFYWLDNYCRNNPLRPIAAGLGKFADEVTDNAYGKASDK